MATITLKEGDFGGEAEVIVGDAALYLPDRSRPGLNERVALTDVAEIEAIGDDRSAQFKEAARLSARGFLSTGNPLGLAAGVFAVSKVKDIEFSVRLKDGRGFIAVASAKTYAALREACRTAPILAGEDVDAATRADAVIAKYLGPGALPGGPATPSAGEPGDAGETPASGAPGPARPVFGRRKTL